MLILRLVSLLSSCMRPLCDPSTVELPTIITFRPSRWAKGLAKLITFTLNSIPAKNWSQSRRKTVRAMFLMHRLIGSYWWVWLGLNGLLDPRGLRQCRQH